MLKEDIRKIALKVYEEMSDYGTEYLTVLSTMYDMAMEKNDKNKARLVQELIQEEKEKLFK